MRSCWRLALLTLTACSDEAAPSSSLPEPNPPLRVEAEPPPSISQSAKTEDNGFLLAETDHPHAEDLLFIRDVLADNHPGFVSERYDGLVAAFLPTLTGMDNAAFYYAIRQILAGLGDAHTEPVQPELYGDRLIPIWQLKHYDDGWFINGIHTSGGKYLGYEVLAINSIPIEDVVKAAEPYISHENIKREPQNLF